jgi:CHAD domain-containing protein
MRSSCSARAAIDKRLRSLDRGLAADIDTNVEALHQARVATRRLREALPLLAPPGRRASPERRALDDARRAIQEFTRSLGGVRELDVALSVVDEFVSAQPDLQLALLAVRTSIEREREERLGRLRRQVEIRRLRRISRRVAEWAERQAPAGCASALARRVRERACRLRTAVARAGLLYAAERLHQVRIAARKLRYALELAEEIDDRQTRPLVQELTRVQDRLGRMHDLDVVARLARAVFSDPCQPDSVRVAGRAVLQAFEQQIHERHAEHVAERRLLRQVADDAAGLVRTPKRTPPRRIPATGEGTPEPTEPAGVPDN